MTNAMRERLLLEASMLSNKQHMASLIVDEASIKPKCVYDRKADAVYGFKDKPVNSAARTSVTLWRTLFGRLRSMCGGNDVLDARSVTVALDNIVKGKALCSKQMEVEDADAEELALSVPQEVIADLENLKGQLCDPSPSVTYSGLVYVGGYIVKLVKSVDSSHARRTARLIADKFIRLLLVNYTKMAAEQQWSSSATPNLRRQAARRPNAKAVRGARGRSVESGRAVT
ncbi:hypothetical protein HPB47_024009 [Ixodes persulcatus]|uniref:Uncharacterized protein n=1 Tax=Ixodes persulcatus TaxID=34615 RepID=A0AC60Q7Q5_IXOPE|nr:hypothetical protein HPB47_024009 [Ixodes persulcatus]